MSSTRMPRWRVEEMLMVGDRVVGRLRFRIADGRIAENWHLEDNLTLLQQLGAVGR